MGLLGMVNHFPSQNGGGQSAAPNHVVIQIAARASVCCETVRKVLQGKPTRAGTRSRVLSAVDSLASERGVR